MRGLIRVGIGAGAAAALAAVLVVAWADARARSCDTHCRNNLRFLGERALEMLKEARLDPEGDEAAKIREGGGSAFWILLWNVKLKGKGERALNPFFCPYLREGPLAGDRAPGTAEIDYRGPAADPVGAPDWVPLGADRLENHGGGRINVLLIKTEVRRRRRPHGEEENLESQPPQVRSAVRGDSLWQQVLEKTRE